MKSRSPKDTILTLSDEYGLFDRDKYFDMSYYTIPDIEAPTETVPDTTIGTVPFQFNPAKKQGLSTNLFIASNETIIVKSIVTLMHETNAPRQDRINIAEALLHIISSLGELSFDPMAVALSHSTFFTVSGTATTRYRKPHVTSSSKSSCTHVFYTGFSLHTLTTHHPKKLKLPNSSDRSIPPNFQSLKPKKN